MSLLSAATSKDEQGPLVDIEVEARRILAEAAARELPVRLLGGLAVRLRAPHGPGFFGRRCKDIDLVTRRQAGKQLVEMLCDLRWTPDERFNSLNGHRRLLFHEPGGERQIDVFIDSFAMCHELQLAPRLEVDPDSIPLAELLLTKLQIFQLNEKDQTDIFALLHDHDVADADGETINAARVAELCAADWGLWRTSKLNVERTSQALEALAPEMAQTIRDRLQRLWQTVEREPKSRRWRLRDRIGDRVTWYEEPEEVD